MSQKGEAWELDGVKRVTTLNKGNCKGNNTLFEKIPILHVPSLIYKVKRGSRQGAKRERK